MNQVNAFHCYLKLFVLSPKAWSSKVQLVSISWFPWIWFFDFITEHNTLLCFGFSRKLTECYIFFSVKCVRSGKICHRENYFWQLLLMTFEVRTNNILYFQKFFSQMNLKQILYYIFAWALWTEGRCKSYTIKAAIFNICVLSATSQSIQKLKSS